MEFVRADIFACARKTTKLHVFVLLFSFPKIQLSNAMGLQENHGQPSASFPKEKLQVVGNNNIINK